MKIRDLIPDAAPFLADLEPWEATSQSDDVVRTWFVLLEQGYIADRDYTIRDGVAIHATAIVEPGAVLKAPCIIGPHCFVAAYAYLRGGVWLEDNVIIGPSCELKSTFIHAGSKTAHFNFVGDSVIGHSVNIEAGAILANYRNERDDKRIRVRIDNDLHDTGVDKFGACVGNGTRIGANAVLAPGTLLKPQSLVRRLELIDQTN